MACTTAVVVVLVTAVTTCGLVLASTLHLGTPLAGQGSEAARLYAGYLTARNVVLVGGMLGCLPGRNWRGMAALLALNGLTQAGDVAVGALAHDTAKTVGPACFAVALLVTSAWLARLTRK